MRGVAPLFQGDINTAHGEDHPQIKIPNEHKEVQAWFRLNTFQAKKKEMVHGVAFIAS